MKRIVICLVCVMLVFGFLVDLTPYLNLVSRASAGEELGEFWVIYPYGERRRITLTPAKAKRRYTIGVSYPHFKDPYWISVSRGNVIQAKEAGVNLLIKAAGGYVDLVGQIATVENFVQQGVDAIILGPISFEGNTASALEAQKKGVPVILSGQTINTHNHAGLASQDLYDLGVSCAEWTVKLSGGKAKIAYIPGPSGASWTEIWYEGCQYVFRDYPGIEVLATKWIDPDIHVAQNTMENLLQTFPRIDYVLSTSVMVNGEAQAIEAAGRETKIIQDFLAPVNFPFVKSGTVVVGLAGTPVLTGRLALDLAVRVLNDQKDRHWVVNPEPYVITPENLDKVDPLSLWAPKGWMPPAVFKP